jgi:hypothetical protein
MSCKVCDGLGMVKTLDLENGGREVCPECHPPEERPKGLLERFWRWVQARFRLNLEAVCEMSKGLGPHEDYHDWADSVENVPWHFHLHRCRRCGKEFSI